jgi:hypothetical protein
MNRLLHFAPRDHPDLADGGRRVSSLHLNRSNSAVSAVPAPRISTRMCLVWRASLSTAGASSMSADLRFQLQIRQAIALAEHSIEAAKNASGIPAATNPLPD